MTTLEIIRSSYKDTLKNLSVTISNINELVVKNNNFEKTISELKFSIQEEIKKAYEQGIQDGNNNTGGTSLIYKNPQG